MGILLVAVGAFTIFCTLTKPGFYWNSRRAQRMRRFIGDGATTLLYLVIGAAVFIAGALEIFGVIAL